MYYAIELLNLKQIPTKYGKVKRHNFEASNFTWLTSHNVMFKALSFIRQPANGYKHSVSVSNLFGTTLHFLFSTIAADIGLRRHNKRLYADAQYHHNEMICHNTIYHYIIK